MRRLRRIHLRTVFLVARKELWEALRDRRTLFVALVLPVLIYPIVVLGLGPVVSVQQQKLAETRQQIAVTGADAELVKSKVLVPYLHRDETEAKPPTLEVVESANPGEDLSERRIQLWVVADEGFAEALASGGTATVKVRFDGSDDGSLQARQKWRDAYDAAAKRELDARLEAQGLSKEWREPLVHDEEDVAPPERSGAYVIGRILALLLVLMTVTSSFYPAVDAVAGEKERGTMETLLVAPCGRVELVLGKFVAVFSITLAAAIFNLASLAFTSGPLVMSMVQTGRSGLSISAGMIFGILLLLIPMAALFSAVALSLSTLARSVKEAQHYLSPLVMLVMPLAMIVVLPNLPLTPLLAAVPVTNSVLFFRDLLLGRTEWLTTLIVMASTVAFAALAIWASVLLFLREETLFRGPEGTGALIRRPARPRLHPTAPAAVFLFAVILALLWYAQGVLPQDVESNVFLLQVLVVLLPCLFITWWLKLDFRATFRIKPPSKVAWVAAVLAVPLGLALPILSQAIHWVFGGDTMPVGPSRDLQEILAKLIVETPWYRLVLVLAILPAVCEELVYRGFILSGFEQAWTSRRGRIGAVLVTAAFFGVSHVFPDRIPNTFVMGIVLCLLALWSDSLIPPVIVHAIHNGLIVLQAKYHDAEWARLLFGEKHLDQPTPPDMLRVAVAALVSVAIVAAVFVLHRMSLRAAVRGQRPLA